MLNLIKLCFLFMCFCSHIVFAQNCNVSKIPYDFLSKNIENLVSEFTEIAENRNFENESLNDKDNVLLLVIWKGEYFLDLLISDNVVEEIRVKDARLNTRRCIRVGSKFSEVVKAYPEAKFGNIYDLSYVRNGGEVISFGFNTRDLPFDNDLPVNKQKIFKVTDPEIQDLTLSVIRIYQKKHL